MSIGTALREALPKYVPTWLVNSPLYRRLYSIVWSVAAVGDMYRQIALEGQYAAYPGVGTPTANGYLGASRGLLQGPAESDTLFAERLVAFRGGAKEMGSAEQRARQVQDFLVGQGSLGAGVYPVVRCIDRAGRWVTIDASQNATYGTVAWHWDDSGGWVDATGFHPPSEVDTYWSDVWVLIQDPFTHYTSFTDPNWLAAWNSGDQTFGMLCPQAVVSGIESICSTWKGAHIYVRQIVWCTDPTSFAPNGFYGNSSDNPAGTQVPARATTSSGHPAFGYWSHEDAG